MIEMIDELDEASLQEGTELGEYWRRLCRMWRVIDYSGSPDFKDSLQKEIVTQHTFLKENFTWIEYEAIDCDKCGKGRPAYRELVWNEDL
jgi:hypothetical protein